MHFRHATRVDDRGFASVQFCEPRHFRIDELHPHAVSDAGIQLGGQPNPHATAMGLELDLGPTYRVVMNGSDAAGRLLGARRKGEGKQGKPRQQQHCSHGATVPAPA